MMDGIIFYLSLLASIAISNYFKKIDDVDFKRNFGAAWGFTIVFVICKIHIVEYVILVCGNIILLRCCKKRYVHQTTLMYSWLVLLHMHFNARCSKYVIWLFQTITLKLVGMGFDRATGETFTKSTEGVDDEIVSVIPSPSRLLLFAFYFIGIHRGPYYRWKTYQDHFNIPFNVYGDCWKITEFKLKRALAFLIVRCILRTYYPLSVYASDSFYTNYSPDYRFIINVPYMVIYILEEMITMMLCTSVFTEAGLGLYPAKCKPTPGSGATAELDLLHTISAARDEALKEQYNFSMLSCFNIQKILIGPKMKDSLRGWNMPNRQWFWANTYKNFIRSNKEVRSACAFVLWSIWIGPSKRHIIEAVTIWVYVHLEDEYELLYDTSGPMKVTWNIAYSSMRIFCLIYLVPCTVLQDSRTVVRYYNSLYWAYHFVLASLTIGAIILHKSQPPLAASPPPLKSK